jgi:hypothetical protein
MRAELSEKYNTAPKARRLLREYYDDGHFIVFTVTKIMGRWAKMGQTLRYYLYFAMDKLQKF